MKTKASATPPDKSKKPQKQHSAFFYLSIAFCEGAAVIAVELLGAKMLNPYYGNSLPVWTAVIGITVGFLTIGYFLGGLLASSKSRMRFLSYAFAFASLLIIIMPLWSRQLFLLAENMSLYTGSTLVAMLLLGPPLLCLGTTSPLIIQQITQQVQHAGKSAGSVYAISTLGGIVFTFLLGFLIIPQFGISKPLIILSVVLMIIAPFIFFEKKQLVVMALVIVVFFTSFAGSSKGDDEGHFRIMHNSEGMLGQLKVVEAINPEIADPVRYLLINGVANTYMVNMERYHFGYSGWMYVHKLAMIASLKHHAKNVLLLGFGGGTIATEFQNMGMKVDAVDYDSRMLDIAKKYFYFNDTATNFITDDARHYLRTVKKKYDLIVFDVLNSDTQPSYIFTRESLSRLKDILAHDGMVIIEFQEYEKKEGTYVYQSICNTLLSLNYKTYLNEGDDRIIVASLNEIDSLKFSYDYLTPCCKAQNWAGDFIKHPFTQCMEPFKNALILTDDKPVIDVLNAETIKKWRINAINSYANNMLNTKQDIFE